MTHKQLEKAAELLEKTALDFFAPERESLRAIEMMHSILVYHYKPSDTEFPYPIDNPYLSTYCKTLGEERMKQLWKEQVADFRKARVTDAGNGYRRCWWGDE